MCTLVVMFDEKGQKVIRMTRSTKFRAKPQGRATRTKTVGKPRGIKPLPLHLAVLPQMLVRTPLNPGCETTRSHWGAAVAMAGWSVDSFLRGRDLRPRGAEWEVHVDGNVYSHDDALYALAWTRAASLRGIPVQLVRA